MAKQARGGVGKSKAVRTRHCEQKSQNPVPMLLYGERIQRRLVGDVFVA